MVIVYLHCNNKNMAKLEKRNSLTISGLSDACWEKIRDKKKDVLDKQNSCSTGEAIERLILGDKTFEENKSQEAK